MSLVSVVMPTWNSAAWVADTIDSLSAQTYSPLELIVVDDGSEDDSVKVARDKLRTAFRHPWRVIQLDGNRGPSAARNVGLGAANGAWVQFLDSDDFMAPTKLELQMARCEQLAADVTAIYSPWRQCYVDGGRLVLTGEESHPDMTGKDPVMCLVGSQRPLHNAGLARRSALEQVGGFDEGLRFWECEELTVRLAKAGRLAPVASDGPLYFWRLHHQAEYLGGGEARYDAREVALLWIDLVLKALGPRAFGDLSAPDRREILRYSSGLARLAYRQDRAAFREYLTRARRLDPKLRPTHPTPVAALATLVGYEAAENIADLGRRTRALVQRLSGALSGRAPASA